ncbi:MAG TPA: MoxR family ATPase [bacterium]|jgi:MoxR-like ATPase|nr:MoxR family ATPase [bacterium]HNT64473.1 MoxR family ATPase [bacterium]HOX84680.1 MoxR family ATPase [bacterium]HPG45403.1 MoxR family ATPase [bacterium]HPM96821.1 MoxR family ATPase [bacterium]
MSIDISALNAQIEKKSAFVEKINEQVKRVIVGQQYMIDRLMIGLLANGHILLEGVPGLAKTMTIKTLSDTITTQFQRIQFTPDLLPADIIGTMIYDQEHKKFTAKTGPVFANLILADEINRSPAKVQSALLEAMQERQVTIGETTFALPSPFLVLATQNPIEHEGTYPLPEAQVDRFMLKLSVGYPNRQEELEIMRRMTQPELPTAAAVVSPEDIMAAQKAVHEVYIDPKVENYIVDIVFATRKPKEYGLDEVAGLIEYGASPRASIYLSKAAKAHAFLRRRGYVTPEDVRAIGMDVLRHRIILTYEAEAEDMTSENLVNRIINHIEVP